MFTGTVIQYTGMHGMHGWMIYTMYCIAEIQSRHQRISIERISRWIAENWHGWLPYILFQIFFRFFCSMCDSIWHKYRKITYHDNKIRKKLWRYLVLDFGIISLNTVYYVYLFLCIYLSRNLNDSVQLGL